jgi:hypothetical protein
MLSGNTKPSCLSSPLELATADVAVATRSLTSLGQSKPKKYPDRRTAEGDKPSKRKPDKHVVSVHEPVLTPGISRFICLL